MTLSGNILKGCRQNNSHTAVCCNSVVAWNRSAIYRQQKPLYAEIGILQMPELIKPPKRLSTRTLSMIHYRQGRGG